MILHKLRCSEKSRSSASAQLAAAHSAIKRDMLGSGEKEPFGRRGRNQEGLVLSLDGCPIVLEPNVVLSTGVERTVEADEDVLQANRMYISSVRVIASSHSLYLQRIA